MLFRSVSQSRYGSVATSVGLDYRNLRSDVEYGTKVGDGLYMHVGGFYRQGVGPRDIGFNGNDGGQIKANLLKEFDNGYVKVYVKALRDHTAAYMPMPMTVILTYLFVVFHSQQEGLSIY